MFPELQSNASPPRLPFLASAVLLLASTVSAHDPSQTGTFVSLLPTTPFSDQIAFVTLIGPDVGLTITHATLDVTWVSDGTFPASDLLLHYEISTDGVINEFVVTGAELGWGSGEGVFVGSVETDLLNGQTFKGAIFGTKFEVDIFTSTGMGGVTGRFIAGSALTLETAVSFKNMNEVFNISLSGGGSQQLSVRAPASEAGKLYWIFGSATGTSPGLAGPAGTLPLKYDGYFQFTINRPNTHISQSMGVLNTGGEANAVLTIPPGVDQSLAGVELNHAYVVFDIPGTAAVTHVSNSLLLRLIS